MTRIRWYGPTLALVIAVLLVMLVGPGLVRHLSWHQVDRHVELARDSNLSNVSLADLSAAFRNVATAVRQSVVHIQIEGRTPRHPHRNFRDRMNELFPHRLSPRNDDDLDVEEYLEDDEDDRTYRSFGNGSGWVYDEEHIVTNNHVVEEGDRIIVILNNKSERVAEVVGKDRETDIAILRVKGGDLHPATLARRKVEQGEIVFAFGSPFGFEFSMSQGIVSAIGRKPGILSRVRGYENFIQTDAAINRGNSGGPLTNIYGEVVGMNTAIATHRNPHANFNGVGFAIPAHMIRRTVDNLIENGRVIRGFLGVLIDDLNENAAWTFGYEGDGVLVVSPITDGPAADAGIQADDIITSIDGEPMSSMDKLRNLVAARAPGTTVKVGVFRGTTPDEPGELLTFDVEIAEKPEGRLLSSSIPAPRVGVPDPPEDDTRRDNLETLGIQKIRKATANSVESYRRKFVPGILVLSVRPGSAAEEAGIVRGHIITAVFDTAVNDVETLLAEISRHDINRPVRLRIHDGNIERAVFLETDDDDS